MDRHPTLLSVLFDDPDRLGVCRVALYADDGRLSVRVRRRYEFRPRHQEHLRWRRSTPHRMLTLKTVPGRMRLYETEWKEWAPKDRRTRDRSPGLPGSFPSLLAEDRPGYWPPGSRQALAAAAREAMAEWAVAEARRRGQPTPAEPRLHGAAQSLQALCYPLLVPVLDAGGALPPELPTTLTPMFIRPTARAAAVRAFGRLATRPVIAALGRCLAGRPRSPWSDAPPSLPLDVLQLALVATVWRQPERVADVLAAGGQPQGEPLLLSADELAWTRAMLAGMAPRRGAAILLDTLQQPDGLRLLRDAARCHQDGATVPDRPAGVTALHDDLAAQAAIAASAVYDLAAPPELLALDGRPAGADDLTFLVPRTTADLAAWGRVMHNCIASYAREAVAGRTWLVGVEAGGALRYNLELRPAGRVVQFAGRHNQAPSPADAAAVMAALAATPLLSGTVRPVHGPEIPRPPGVAVAQWGYDDFDFGDEPF